MLLVYKGIVERSDIDARRVERESHVLYSVAKDKITNIESAD